MIVLSENEMRILREHKRMKDLVRMAVAVVEDFLPNIGRCALQDYDRLNTFLIESKKALEEGGK